MSRLDDLAVNCAARKVLVRHWIDLGKASLRTINGVLTIRGTLERLNHAANPLCPSAMCEMANELRRIRNVRRLMLNLDNWVERDGKWFRIDKKPTMPMLQQPVPTGTTIEINEAELPKDVSGIA